MSVPDTTAPYWSRDVDDLSTSLKSSSNGLTTARAAERLAVVGPNTVEDAQRLGPLRLLWRQVESPLVLILIFAAAVFALDMIHPLPLGRLRFVACG